MRGKAIITNTYLLQRDGEDNKGFGYVQGFAYLPNYDTEIKIYISNDRFAVKSDIDHMHLLTLDCTELESIHKAAEFINHSLETLISLAKRDLLKEECFIDEKE